MIRKIASYGIFSLVRGTTTFPHSVADARTSHGAREFLPRVRVVRDPINSSRLLDVLNMRGGTSDRIDAEASSHFENVDDEYESEEYSDFDGVTDIADGYETQVEGNGADEPFFMSPLVQVFVTLACMFLGQRFDLFHPFNVKLIRFAFVTQVLLQQIFVLYVRVAAKRIKNITPVDVRNQFSDALLSQVDQAGVAPLAMVKKLTSSFLSPETTVMDYDLKQASNIQSGVIFNMSFMWFLHFKLEKVQPLLIHIVTNFVQLVYNPLFQVYILGRNLERPFKTVSNNLSNAGRRPSSAQELDG